MYICVLTIHSQGTYHWIQRCSTRPSVEVREPQAEGSVQQETVVVFIVQSMEPLNRTECFCPITLKIAPRKSNPSSRNGRNARPSIVGPRICGKERISAFPAPKTLGTPTPLPASASCGTPNLPPRPPRKTTLGVYFAAQKTRFRCPGVKKAHTLERHAEKRTARPQRTLAPLLKSGDVSGRGCSFVAYFVHFLFFRI